MAAPFFNVYLLFSLFRLLQFVSSLPSPPFAGKAFESQSNSAFPFSEFEPVGVKRDAVKVPLRILSLGASIVSGVGSTNHNGFRKPLRDALRFDGWEVNMVGSRQYGDMVDWDVEATPGDILTQIYDALDDSIGYKANVVLINGGTNDANENITVYQAGQRMENILKKIWNATGMDDTCIVLSTLIPTTVPTGVVNRPIINEQFRNLVGKYKDMGKRIVLADMDPVMNIASGWISTTDDMISDGIHPNDEGHRKMAYVWYKAINAAFQDNEISAPSGELTLTPPGCDKVYNSGHDAGGKTQLGSGNDDAIYLHDSVSMGVILSIESAFDRDQWRFARLFSRDRDDFVGWFNQSATEHRFGVWKNNDGNFTKIADLNPDLFCYPEGIHFIDMNADGLDDLVCIDPDGDAYLSINQGDGTATTPPTFKRVSDTALIKSNEGYKQSFVRMADIDGDGRGDYCALDDKGDIHCWRNGWVDDIPKYWESLGIRFRAKGKGDYRGVRFEDINGDGRDDWMWVSDVGAVETWTNARSCQKGKVGDGLNVAWRQGFHKGQTSGNTHYGIPEYGDDLRDRIHFGRIYGSVAAFGELPLQDYIYVNASKEGDGDDAKYKVELLVWKNLGAGGAKLKSDGDKYCNMKGHQDGSMDYVWTWSTGKMLLYPNAGKKEIQPGESYWGPVEDMWDPGRDLDRRDLHLVDWDGDGLCDIVWVDPDNNNHVQLWRNGYGESGKWDWTYNANPAPALSCSEKRGLGIHDLPVRFADITGNGRGHYLCIQPNGQVTGFIHNADDSWASVGQIKFAQDKDRANLRWADVNGDGKDDMLWVDKFTGDATVWYDRGPGNPADNGGSSYHWEETSGPVYSGNVAGTCMYYPDLDGNGRADQHSILDSLANTAVTSLNPSCGLTDHQGDDPGGVIDPKLPVQPSDNSSGGDTGGGSDLPPFTPSPHAYDPFPNCDQGDTYNTLDAIELGAGTIPLQCGAAYVLPVLLGMLQSAKADYEEILKDHYDYYFSVYAEYVVQQTPQQYTDYVSSRANTDFKCNVVEMIVCCRNCDLAYPDQNCEYCDNAECTVSGGGSFPVLDIGYENKSEPCPPDYSKRGVFDITIGETYKSGSTYWTLPDDKHDDFFSGAADIVGTAIDKIVFQRVSIPAQSDTVNPDHTCAFDYDDHPDCANREWWHNYPELTEYTTDDVTNPKDTASKAIGSTAPLIDDLVVATWEVLTGDYDDFPEDLVDAVSLPVLMVQQAVDSMKDILALGKEIDEENKLDFLLNFLTAIFFVLPFFGDVAELAQLGRVLGYIGDAGNAALDIYGTVQDPKSAPMAIVDIVLGAKGLRDAEGVRKAADLRRAIDEESLGKLSPSIQHRLDQISLSVNKGADDPMLSVCALP